MANINWASSEGRYPYMHNQKDGVTTTNGKVAIWARPNITMWLKLYNNNNNKYVNIDTGYLGDTTNVGKITSP